MYDDLPKTVGFSSVSFQINCYEKSNRNMRNKSGFHFVKTPSWDLRAGVESQAADGFFTFLMIWPRVILARLASVSCWVFSRTCSRVVLMWQLTKQFFCSA